MNSAHIEFGRERKMIEFGVAFEQFEFDVTTQGRKEMGGLGRHGLRGRLLQRGILLERLVRGFHVPSFVIDGGHPVTIHGGLAGDQIVNACRTLFVGEDSFEEQQRKSHPLQIHPDRFHRFPLRRVHSRITSLPLGFLTQGHFAIGFQPSDELLSEGEFDKIHVFRRCIPDCA